MRIRDIAYCCLLEGGKLTPPLRFQSSQQNLSFPRPGFPLNVESYKNPKFPVIPIADIGAQFTGLGEMELIYWGAVPALGACSSDRWGRSIPLLETIRIQISHFADQQGSEWVLNLQRPLGCVCVCVCVCSLAPQGNHGQMRLPGKARNRSLVWLPPKGWMHSPE